MLRKRLAALLLTLLLAACRASAATVPATAAPTPSSAPEPKVLRLATTTSTADSGLLDAILPDFEQQYTAKVEVVAVGTGSRMWLTSRRANLSKTMSCPRRGVMVKSAWPSRRSIVSPCSPAAFTT